MAGVTEEVNCEPSLLKTEIETETHFHLQEDGADFSYASHQVRLRLLDTADRTEDPERWGGGGGGRGAGPRGLRNDAALSAPGFLFGSRLGAEASNLQVPASRVPATARPPTQKRRADEQ